MTSVHLGVEGDQLTISVDMAEVARELGHQLDQCQQAGERARQRWEESEWYLGEARETIAGLEARAQAQADAFAQLDALHQETTTRLQEAEQRRDELTQCLDELQQAHEELLRQTIDLKDQLALAHREAKARLLEEAEACVAGERNHRQTVQADLRGARTAGERRRALRARRSDITVELQRPDGAVLFNGPLRDISRTGMGFACDQLGNGTPELLWVTLQPDGLERPIEALARLAWLRQEESSGSYEGGCELIDVSPGSRSAFEEVFGPAD